LIALRLPIAALRMQMMRYSLTYDVVKHSRLPLNQFCENKLEILQIYQSW